jgi:hypothetical protein
MKGYRKKSWGRTMDCSTRKGEKVKVVKNKDMKTIESEIKNAK